VSKTNYENLTALLAGEDYRRLKVQGYQPLVVERLDASHISLCHYGEMNGDAMRDPEVVFLVEGNAATPVYFRNDYVLVEEATREGLFGDVPVRPDRQEGLERFVADWWRNLEEQGFFRAAEKCREVERRRPAQDMAREHDVTAYEVAERKMDSGTVYFLLAHGVVQSHGWFDRHAAETALSQLRLYGTIDGAPGYDVELEDLGQEVERSTESRPPEPDQTPEPEPDL
jgi:hypothetical protein